MKTDDIITELDGSSEGKQRKMVWEMMWLTKQIRYQLDILFWVRKRWRWDMRLRSVLAN